MHAPGAHRRRHTSPSSTAGLVAGSSTIDGGPRRRLFTSTSEAPPMRITATRLGASPAALAASRGRSPTRIFPTCARIWLQRPTMSCSSAGAFNDGGVLLLDEHPLRPAEHGQRQVLELQTKILGDHWPPVRIPMSSSIAFRRSPKPGPHGRDLQSTRILFTTRVASASPSTPGHDQQDRPAGAGDLLHQGDQGSAMALIFFS